MKPAERARLTAGIFALLAMAGLVVVSIATVSLPSPVVSTAPADQFSAERAFQHVERIASAVHSTGSPAADDVREHIVSTLTGLGLPTRVQDDIGANEPYNYARVRNVVAVLAGTAPTGKVFLVAHYDSATASFAASDDGVGVAVLLEVAR
ncbi:MAG: M28 family peptidase, partial [Nakamurella sp.]